MDEHEARQLAALQGRRDGQSGAPCNPPAEPELAALYRQQYQEGRATRADLAAYDAAQALTDDPIDAAELAELLGRED